VSLSSRIVVTSLVGQIDRTTATTSAGIIASVECGTNLINFSSYFRFVTDSYEIFHNFHIFQELTGRAKEHHHRHCQLRLGSFIKVSTGQRHWVEMYCMSVRQSVSLTVCQSCQWLSAMRFFDWCRVPRYAVALKCFINYHFPSTQPANIFFMSPHCAHWLHPSSPGNWLMKMRGVLEIKEKIIILIMMYLCKLRTEIISFMFYTTIPTNQRFTFRLWWILY